MIIYIFGDSITQGLWDSKGGWADRIKAFVQANEVKSGFKNYHKVFNLGVDGNTTGLILRRFEAEVAARMWPHEEYAFIFAIGINDTLSLINQNFEPSSERYIGELAQLTELAKKLSDKIMFVDLTPVDEKLTNPVQPSTTGVSYKNDRIAKFNKCLHTFSDKHSLTCVKVSEKFAKRDYNKLLVDGLHPNDEGHELIYLEILPKVEEWLA